MRICAPSTRRIALLSQPVPCAAASPPLAALRTAVPAQLRDVVGATHRPRALTGASARLQVRQMLGEGQVAEAQALCAEVTDTLIASLLEDKGAYKEYVAQWELQRKYAVSEAVDLSIGAAKKQVGVFFFLLFFFSVFVFFFVFFLLPRSEPVLSGQGW